MSNGDRKRPYRRSLFFPLLLVVVGVVLLLSNIGVLTGDTWDIVWRLWPLLLILGGLDGFINREGWGANTFWIASGVLFLLSNFGRVGWGVWELILQLWPVLLLGIGLDVIFGRRSLWGGLLSIVLVLAVMGGMLTFLGKPAGTLTGTDISQPLQDARQATLNLKPVVGSLSILPLVDSKNLVEGKVQRWQGEDVRQSYEVSGGTGTFELATTGGRFMFPTGVRTSPTWELKVNTSVPLQVNTNLAVGEVNLDLTKLQLTGLDASYAVGKMTIQLPESGEYNVKLSGAIGEIVVVVPRGAALRVQSSTGLGNLEAPSGYTKQGNTYTSPGFTSAAKGITLTVSQAIGRIVIQEK